MPEQSPPRILLLLVAGLMLATGCGGTETALAQDTPAFDRSLPELSGSILDRDDLRHIARMQNSRDTIGLLTHVEDPDPAIRARVALAFGSIRAPEAAPALYPLLDDEEAAVRALAAFAIGQSGQVLAPPALIDALHRETDAATLVQLMDALGRIGDRPALGALTTAATPSVNEADRALAIARFGIRGVHDPGAVRRLAAQLTSEDGRLRRNAAYYFGRVTETDPWAIVADSVLAAAASLDPADEAQLFLATALGRLQTSEAEEHLLSLLSRSSDWRIRVNAVRGLGGEWRSDSATEALLDALDDPVHHVATAAATALATGERLTDEQLARLETRLGADAWQVWTAFLPAFATAGHVDPIIRALEMELPVPARAAVVRTLGGDDSAAGLEQIETALAHPDARIAAAAVEALRQRWQRAGSPEVAEHYLDLFTTALRRAEGATVYYAAPALGDSLFLTMGAGEHLRDVYDQLVDRRKIGGMDQIIRAHAAARDTAALDFLIARAVDAPHPVLRQAAVETLTERFGEGFHFRTLGGGPPPFPILDWDYLESLGSNPRLVLETERGTVVLELFTEWAPATVQAITRLAREGVYDGVPFHRVVPNFVIQGGDFDPGDGFGGPDFFLPSEFTPLPYTTGTLGMASLGPDTEGSQFFVTHSMQPHLDGNYTVFGRVVAGQDVVDAIRTDDRVIGARMEPSR